MSDRAAGAVEELKDAGRSMAGDFKAMIADGEDLLKAAGAVSDEGFSVARRKFEGKLKHAKSALVDVSRPMLDMTSEAAADANAYVRANPWTAIGIAAAAGALMGFLAAKR